MREIAIYGAGGLGQEVACMIDYINKLNNNWKFIGFFDDGIIPGTPVSHFGNVIGGIKEINRWKNELDVVLCFGTPNLLEKISNNIINEKISFPNIISPDFRVEDNDTFHIGRGNIIKSHCMITKGISIGDFNLLNGSVVLGHDVKINNYNVFMPGTKISGEVTIGDRNLFGSMSFVKQCLKVGNDVTLSPLSPLLSQPKDGQTYIGNPAKIFKF